MIKYIITSLLIICQMLSSVFMSFINNNERNFNDSNKYKYAHYIIEGKNTKFGQNDYPLEKMINYIEQNTYKVHERWNDRIEFLVSNEDNYPKLILDIDSYEHHDTEYCVFFNPPSTNPIIICISFDGYTITSIGESADALLIQLFDIEDNIIFRDCTIDKEYQEIREDVSIYKLKKYADLRNYKIYYYKDTFEVMDDFSLVLYIVDEKGELKYIYMNERYYFNAINRVVLLCNNATILSYESEENYSDFINYIKY